jgi:hypothetical protein
MELCRARDAYKAEGWWRTLCVVCFGLLLAFHLSRHHWVLAGEIGVLWWLAQWGIPRLIRLAFVGIRNEVRWLKRQAWNLVSKGLHILIGSLVLLSITGCGQMDAMERWNYHLMTGRVIDVNHNTCQAADLHDGRCQLPTAKGATP